jgi:hypothetical protein
MSAKHDFIQFLAAQDANPWIAGLANDGRLSAKFGSLRGQFLLYGINEELTQGDTRSRCARLGSLHNVVGHFERGPHMASLWHIFEFIASRDLEG